MLNESTLDVYIEVSEERKSSSDFNASKLNLTWQTVEFSENKLEVQLNLSNPLAISPKKKRDELVVTFKDQLYDKDDLPLASSF